MTVPAKNVSASATSQNISTTTTGVTTTGGKGSLFLVYIMAWTPNDSVTDSKGNQYTRVCPEVSQLLTSSNGNNTYWLSLWKCVAGVGGASHTVTARQKGASSGYVSVGFVEYLGSTGLDVNAYTPWSFQAALNYLSPVLSPPVPQSLVLSFNAGFSTTNPTTWTHIGDGFTSTSVNYTNGSDGPCFESLYQAASVETPYQAAITATSPTTMQQIMMLFSIGSALAQNYAKKKRRRRSPGGLLMGLNIKEWF